MQFINNFHICFAERNIQMATSLHYLNMMVYYLFQLCLICIHKCVAPPAGKQFRALLFSSCVTVLYFRIKKTSSQRTDICNSCLKCLANSLYFYTSVKILNPSLHFFTYQQPPLWAFFSAVCSTVTKQS